MLQPRVNLRLDNTDIAELLLSILGGDWRRDDNVVTRKPVDGSGNTVLLGGLEGINDTEDLSGVAAGGGGVGHDEADLLGRVDDEDGTDGKSHTCGKVVREKLKFSMFLDPTYPWSQRWWCPGSQPCRTGGRSCARGRR